MTKPPQSGSSNQPNSGEEGSDNSQQRSDNRGGGGEGSSNAVMAEFRTMLREVTGKDRGNLSDREERLLHDNFKVRAKLRDANAEVERSRKSAVPDGAIVLSGDDAIAYTAIKNSGLAFKDVPGRLTDYASLSAEKAQREADLLNERVADELGINARAFAMYAKSHDLVISFKEVRTKDEENPGKFITETVPYVRTKGEDEAKAKPLAEMLEALDDDDLALLTTNAGASRERGSSNSRSRNAEDDRDAERGVRFPRQRSAAPSGAAQDRKRDEEDRARKAQSGGYSL